jgi:hypothetical protein
MPLKYQLWGFMQQRLFNDDCFMAAWQRVVDLNAPSPRTWFT